MGTVPAQSRPPKTDLSALEPDLLANAVVLSAGAIEVEDELGTPQPRLMEETETGSVSRSSTL
jgi:hypothetical protein